MSKFNKRRPLYSIGKGRPFAPTTGKVTYIGAERAQVALHPATMGKVRKMAEASGLPAGLVVAVAVERLLKVPAKVRTADALRLLGVP